MVAQYAGDIFEHIGLIGGEVAALDLFDTQRQITVLADKVVRVVSVIRYS